MCMPGKLSPSIRMLEDEIYHLRKLMEQTYLQEAAFTSEIVIEISRRLDIKINEYMKQKSKLVSPA
ncbi:Spo0E family sporulation regulatory protein-aspartic acid phosphatase [Paenibacillus tarimensis]